jgi:chaperonin GroES
LELVLDGVEQETEAEIRARAKRDFEPLGELVLVHGTKADKTKGGIFIPEMAREQPAEGYVIAVGPGHRNADGNRSPIWVKPGETILFQRVGVEVQGFDGTVFLVPEPALLARKPNG